MNVEPEKEKSKDSSRKKSAKSADQIEFIPFKKTFNLTIKTGEETARIMRSHEIAIVKAEIDDLEKSKEFLE